MSKIESIIKDGNRRDGYRGPNGLVTCKDGFNVSVIAGGGSYSHPRNNEPGPYEDVELGFPSERPEPWATWEAYAEMPSIPTDTVYGYVPVGMVRELIALHGGEA